MSTNFKLTISSIGLSGACFVLPFIFPGGELLGAGAGLVWLVIAVYSLVRFRKEGLWFLLGAPLALYWPIILAVILAGCPINAQYCP